MQQSTKFTFIKHKKTYPCFLISSEAHGTKGGAPLFEFIHPIGKCWFWYNNHVRSINVAVVLHVSQQRDCLKGFSQTHLISQNTIDAIFIQWNHPIETTNLIVPHLTAFDEKWWCIKACNKGSFLSSLDFFHQFLIFFFFSLSMSVISCLCCFLFFAGSSWFQFQGTWWSFGSWSCHEMTKKLSLFQEIVKPLATVHFLQKQFLSTNNSQNCYRKTLTVFLSKSSLPLERDDRDEDSVCY